MEDLKLTEVFVPWYCWNSSPCDRGQIGLENKRTKFNWKLKYNLTWLWLWWVERAYSKLKFPNLEKSTDASVSDILLFLNTLQDGTFNV